MGYEVQQTRWDRLVRRVSGSIGPGSRVSETLTELFPVLDVENVPGELLLLGGTAPCFGGGTISSAAGESPTAQLFNPADSGHLVTVTSVIFATNNDATLRYGLGLIALGTAISTQLFRDTRRILPALPVAQVRQRSAVAQANATMQSRLLANAGIQIADENGVCFLAPGTGFEIGIPSLAATIFYGFNWRERPVEESELSL